LKNFQNINAQNVAAVAAGSRFEEEEEVQKVVFFLAVV